MTWRVSATNYGEFFVLDVGVFSLQLRHFTEPPSCWTLTIVGPVTGEPKVKTWATPFHTETAKRRAMTYFQWWAEDSANELYKAHGLVTEHLNAEHKLRRRSLPVVTCQADDDDACDWDACPQIRDGEPTKSGRSCPLDNRSDDDR